VLFDKIVSFYFILKTYLYFSIGNGQPREPALCQLYRHTFVPYASLKTGTVLVPWAGQWPLPMLKYKYIFPIKYKEAILSNSTRKLLRFEIVRQKSKSISACTGK